jgi:hypothetical protein
VVALTDLDVVSRLGLIVCGESIDEVRSDLFRGAVACRCLLVRVVRRHAGDTAEHQGDHDCGGRANRGDSPGDPAAAHRGLDAAGKDVELSLGVGTVHGGLRVVMEDVGDSTLQLGEIRVSHPAPTATR